MMNLLGTLSSILKISLKEWIIIVSLSVIKIITKKEVEEFIKANLYNYIEGYLFEYSDELEDELEIYWEN